VKRAFTSVALALVGLAGTARAQDDFSAQTVRLVDNGFCAGLAWVTLLPGETVTRDIGPDFYVYRVKGPGDRGWGAYSGFAGQSRPDRRRALVSKDGASVFRGTGNDGAFNGYFVGDDHEQNHFFANFFKGDATDAPFFDRIELGRKGSAKCKKYNVQ
jgi:hypothetical protein